MNSSILKSAAGAPKQFVTSSGCACHFTSRDAMTEEELEIADVRNEGDIPAKRSLLS